MSSMAVNKTACVYLPPEIQLIILDALLQDGCSLASFATVSREWQAIIERHNFARIKLTPSRLADLNSTVRRNRHLVGYVWLCLELQEYDCTECATQNSELWPVSDTDNILITTAIQRLFSTLSAWEPDGDLLLDISVHSPSDSEHWFKYLTFGPDLPPDECARVGCVQQAMLAKLDDHRHGWLGGSQDVAPDRYAIYNVFEEIMGEGPFVDEEPEYQWWRQLPPIPAVTGVLLRQQNRRRWKPKSLAQMFARLPRLQEIHYEPWREWLDSLQQWTDRSYQSLFESLNASNRLLRLVLFENFNEQYPDVCMGCGPIRIPTSAVSRTVANASLLLEHLSASFMVDAGYFLDAREPAWKWPNLTSLVLTSLLLTPDESPAEIGSMLQAAAAAALKMPKLETMEIWNGRQGLAALFRYQSIGGGEPAVVTWRGTWELALQPPVIRAWEAVAAKHRSCGIAIVKELLDVAVPIRSHGDTIHYLKLSRPVLRPVSLQQIRMEHNVRGGVLPV